MIPKRLFVGVHHAVRRKEEQCALPTMRGEDGIPDVDVSITTRELDIMLRANHISPVHLPEEGSTPPLGSGLGAAVVFGATGGVMDAALRSAYYLVTGENPIPTPSPPCAAGTAGRRRALPFLRRAR